MTATKTVTKAWQGAKGPVAQRVEDHSRSQLRAYKEHPPLVLEHANQELAIVDGGYGRKQLYELIQNGADELIGVGGRVEVVLTKRALYCANEGKAVTPDGAATLLGSHVSNKRGLEIGRFGLGFKSVLGVSSRPELFSRSGSFGFDEKRSREVIQHVLPGEKRTPILRIGHALDPHAEAAKDEVLAELMTWATTVVRLPLTTGDVDWLHDDLSDFPPEFLIFSTHVKELVLEDRARKLRRQISIEQENSTVDLIVDGSRTSWHVFSTEHRPSAAAKKDGGYSADRDIVPLYWAVGDSDRLGRLWAFFPTREVVTTDGVFNAPWKLTDDRTTIIPGRFNEELFQEAAMLVLGSLEEVVDPDDPGALMEMLPARGKELRGYADEQLMTRIYEQAPTYACLPNQDGELDFPAALTLHPPDLPTKALVAWSKSPYRPVDWCHHTIESKGNRTTRRSRAQRLISEGSGRTADVTEWLEKLIDLEHPVESSTRAVLIAAIAAESSEVPTDEIRAAKIVLAADSQLVAAVPGSIFIPAEADIEVDVPTVHADLVAAPGVVEALGRLGLSEVSAVSLLDARLMDSGALKPGADWAEIWELARRCDRETVLELLEKNEVAHDQVSIRTRGGSWSRLVGVLLPGSILREEELEDGDFDVLIDTDWHGRDLDLLRDLGVAEGPVERCGSTDEPWYREYRAEALRRFKSKLKGPAPSDDSIIFDGLDQFAGPATPLTCLSAFPAARFASAAIAQTPECGAITVRHKTNANYPQVHMPHPLVWLLKSSGVVLTTLGVVPLELAVSDDLSEYGQFLPVAKLPRAAIDQLELPKSLSALNETHWSVFHKVVARLDRPDLVARAYAQVAGVAPAPDVMKALVGTSLELREPREVAAAATEREGRLLRQSGHAYLPFTDPAEAAVLVANWGLHAAADLISSEFAAIPVGPGEALADLFPMLTPMLRPDDRVAEVIRCSELRRDWFTDSGRVSDQLDFEFAEGAFYCIESLDEGELLFRISSALGLGLSTEEIEDVLDNAAEQAAADLKKRMRKAKTDAERLLLAIPAEVLRQRLPSVLVEAYAELHGDPDDLAVADLTLAALGLEALSKLSDQLRDVGLQPPTSYAGSRRAIQFVRDLGFDRGYAGFKAEGREETLLVEGPIELPKLHRYQEVTRDAFKDVLAGRGGLRGMLSLPTGAGKTRVSVQALIEAMSPDKGLGSPVLWIAQSDELCEQAVETWVEVWRAMGPPRPLKISRLWSSNTAEPVDEGDQVVVATIQKLGTCVDREEYAWLKEATCVVVDEAHSSTAPSYTLVLTWLGLGRGKERVPLIGLSATPFRGVSESETSLLAARYGNRRLDLGAFDEEPTIARLQALKILAKVDHQVLEGASVPLDDAELASLEETRRLPSSVLARLGEDVDRNRRLIESILAQPSEWPVLVFAASVAHAQTLAALLSREGRPSAAVSGETKSAIRRYTVDQFKRGEIKVMANYGVLTQGFDAPAIRALYIARPTYSPNLYQQMVGRGLRGELNGGKERCLVVNVADNLERYAQELAFHDFDYLWNS